MGDCTCQTGHRARRYIALLLRTIRAQDKELAVLHRAAELAAPHPKK
jgi:hypothetical protein